MSVRNQGESAMAKYNFGTTQNDTLFGLLSEPDVFFGYGIGADKLTGGNLNDVFVLRVDDKTDTINGGLGHDAVDYNQSDRGLSIDLSAGKVSAIFSSGGTHTAVVANLTSIEDATGSNFNDTIVGTSSFNTIDGGFGDDILNGGAGINTVSFASHDRLLMGSGDQFSIMLGRNGADGNDNWLGHLSGNQYQVLESDTLRNFQNVIGSNNPEGISGNEQDNTLNGRGGDDVINGFEGNDTINGGAGNDSLIGYSGADTLTGGANSDTFMFVSTLDSPNSIGKFDVITDFEHGIDKIDLSRIDANTASGFQHFAFTDTEVLDAGQVHFYYDAQHDLTVVEANTSGVGTNEFHLQLFGHINLTQTDFIL
jgi:Ca2+-binding RTX toxin-like protein